ncbi:hypothetical protein QMA66_01180 [Leuconostoc suionicum]|uniref:hypothetical protein n=1 Tax=Leuconostoc suionicum TaxID=1511761 RepID=UPI0024AE174A|nr:hypothetical protein [Leuconostoc suionicum]MDI6497116.1 hypothetical protein [Leuconostoc suionicum]
MPLLNLEDWAALIGIIGAVLGGLTGLIKMWIINPLSGEIKQLNGNFNTLNTALDQSRSDMKNIENRIDEHDVALATHSEQIHTLFNKNDK